MIKNYFKIAWRNLERNKVYSFINITGLAIGLAVCMIILLYVGHEYSYDRFHKNADRIVQVIARDSIGDRSMLSNRMSYTLAPITKQYNPVIEDYVRIFSEYNRPVIQNPQSASQKFVESNFVFADSNFFSFFSFKLLEGNKQRVLQTPFTVVISPKIAQKYFGIESPIGKTLRYNDYNFTVTGIVEKAPSNSSIDYDFIGSLTSLSSMKETKDLTSSQLVQGGAFQTYFLLNKSQDAKPVESNLTALAAKDGDPKHKSTYIAMPFENLHLDAGFSNSNLKYLKIFPFVAVLVLLLAVINYISLSTARSAIRAKEIGVRKVMGAGRKTIAEQFFIESGLYTLIAFVIGYVLCATFQPMFFNFLQIDLDTSFLYSPTMLSSFAILFIITVILSATYPSLLLSAYKPVMVLYGKFSKKSGGISVRKFFTVFQFSISVLLIICGIVIDRQMYFFRHADTGVDRENVMMISFGAPMGNQYSAFKKEVQSLASVEQTSTARYQMFGVSDTYFAKAKNSDETVPLTLMNVDENFIKMLGLTWKIAPLDSQYYLSDSVAILNETAVQKMNLGNKPLNEHFLMGNHYEYAAGVLKDFNFQSMESKIDPLCILIEKSQDSSRWKWSELGGSIFVKTNRRANLPFLIQQIQNIYQKYDKADPFEYNFMDDAFNAMYKAEDRLSKIFSVFTAFTLLIACLGLFGLSTFTALQRTKEVGIRKVLGASVSQITTLLSKDFLKLVIISIVIASPLAWWAMNKWLEAFAYRIHISWWMFLIAGAMAVLIAVLTISFQAIKAAMANPVKSLRSE